ncbi:MAG: TonB-dependent receptor [Brevundimonas sp.]|uniref:TonB-dependent receptor n=1 Tax=Brevundimonas sp. TaxID=1871086 RepID=UPI00258E65CA|nr:TonB-dependent receptor [Brevundimonas sp.]MCV0413830.1 TonB-dependent receptor [Brevundimonas sp.]
MNLAVFIAPFVLAGAPLNQANGAGGEVTVSIPSSEAVAAIHRLAAQAGVDVVIVADLHGRRTSALAGRLSVASAFERLLAPLGLRATPLGAGLYRVEPAPHRPPSRPPTRTPAAPAVVLDEVIVTADSERSGIGGANGRTEVAPATFALAEGSTSSAAIANLTATVDSTRQGAGRNKLFIRGVADSAFSGPLQATVGQYLGDIRLTYGSPDPDLVLVDVEGVEVFEGPQGARFASGSIGGVVKIQPAPPEVGARSGEFVVEGSATRGGTGGGGASLVLNGPLGGGAARLVAYARRDGGFVVNTDGQRRDDSIRTTGYRLSTRLDARDWTIDAVAVSQRTTADDSQLVAIQPADVDPGPAVAQPYASAVVLAGVTARRRLGTLRISATTSLMRQSVEERFNATQPDQQGASVVDRSQETVAYSTELRLARAEKGGWMWNLGGAIAFGTTAVTRDRGPLVGEDAPAWGQDIDRRFTEAALFGEAVFKPSGTLSLSAGGRASYLDVEESITPRGGSWTSAVDEPSAEHLAFTPSLAVRWITPWNAQVFARLEGGVRPGGTSELDGGVQHTRSDRVVLLEAGARTPDDGRRWTREISIGRLDWRDIQADTIGPGGDLTTGNIGDGVINFVQARFVFRASDDLALAGGVFANRSRLEVSGYGVIGVLGGRIPNVAPFGAQLSATYGPRRLIGLPFSISANGRYVGESRPGFGVGLDTAQGDYVETDLSARLGGNRALVLRISNVLDASGTRFAVGSPYRVFAPEIAPVRPRSISLGFHTPF